MPILLLHMAGCSPSPTNREQARTGIPHVKVRLQPDVIRHSKDILYGRSDVAITRLDIYKARNFNSTCGPTNLVLTLDIQEEIDGVIDIIGNHESLGLKAWTQRTPEYIFIFSGDSSIIAIAYVRRSYSDVTVYTYYTVQSGGNDASGRRCDRLNRWLSGRGLGFGTL